MREVYAVRSHVPDQQTLASYRMLTASYDSRRVFIVADEVSSPSVEWPSSVHVVRVTRGLVEGLGLRSDLKDAGWRCGDYAHAALTEAVSAERVWMVEPDVAFSRLLPRAFFGLFESDPAALIAHGIGPADGWAWNGTLTHRGFVGPEWRCFFPVTRLTPAAVHAPLSVWSSQAALVVEGASSRTAGAAPGG